MVYRRYSDYVAGVWYGYDNPKEVFYNLSPNPSEYYLEHGYEGSICFKLDEKKEEIYKEIPESDGIVRKSYCRSCGKLRSGTGAYGWYDVDNLPGNCTGNHSDGSYYYNSGGSSSSETTSASNGNNSNTTKSSADKTTQAQTQAPQTEAPTEAPATETPAQ